MECDAPLSIKLNPPRPDGKGGLIHYFPAGCGKCLPCLMRRKAQWSFRIQAEARQAFSSYFVTLTYDDKHVPIGDYQLSGNKLDHKLFIQNLRKLENEKVLFTRKLGSSAELSRKLLSIKEDQPLKYFGCIEYGDRYSRPHLHYILLNIRDTDNINLAWTNRKIRTYKRNGYVPENLGDSFGRIQVDDCNINTIDYVLKYMIKDHEHEDYTGREKEVSFMSKGLGMSLVDDEFKHFIQSPQNNLVVNDRGGKIGLPRYYRKKLLTDSENNRKIAFIKDATEAKKSKDEESLRRLGKDPGLLNKQGKDIRKRLLSKNKMREL